MPRNRRANSDSVAQIDFRRLFARGAFKDVYAGIYRGGRKDGQPCVAKEFRSEYDRYEDPYFDAELRVVRHAQDIIDDFAVARVSSKKISMDTPEIFQRSNGKVVQIEPKIRNFEKFNSNTGWRPNHHDDWTELMQALSHFSYHNSNGQYLLCDVQGGIDRDKWQVKPVHY